MPVAQALENLREDDFEASLAYMVSTQPDSFSWIANMDYSL